MKKNPISIIISLALFAGCNSLLFAETLKEQCTMAYVGKWVFHSIINMDENGGSQFLNAEEYLKVIPGYIDKTDAEAVANEQREKTLIINSQLEICDDGMVYTLTPVPEGISQAEIDQAVAAGEISFRHGMMVLDPPKPWEDRNGELWVQAGTADFFDGQGERPNWEKCVIEDGILTFILVRYKKIE